MTGVQTCALPISGLDVEAFVLEQLASSYSVLTEDERNLGVCLIDIGGGTTDIAVFVDGSICFTDVIPIAGDHVTNDIASEGRWYHWYPNTWWAAFTVILFIMSFLGLAQSEQFIYFQF